MRSESQQTGRRRRGGRRHTSRSPRDNATFTPKAPAKKLGFFARLVAFFTGKPAQAKPAARAASSDHDRVRVAVESKTVETPKPTRKPELLEVTSPKVYVGNLSFDALESDLFELFAGVGSVQNAEIVSHRETQKSKGFAFVTMASIDEAKRAVEELNDKEFMGRRLVISGAKTNDVRDAR
ncbi:MAG: RNA recognition motif domain-containing protein [Chthoniobacteraceae bacterium]